MGYDIVTVGHLYKIKQRNGIPPFICRGLYSSFKEAEVNLVAYLRSFEKPWRLAKYPDEYKIDSQRL